MALTKISDTVAEKTVATTSKVKITLDIANKRVENLTKQLADAQKEVTDLKALGLKTSAEIAAEATPK